MRKIELTPHQVLYRRFDGEFADAWSIYEASWQHVCHGYNTARKTALLEAESPEAAERILKTVPLFEDLPTSEGSSIKGENYLRTFFPKAEAWKESAEFQALIEAEETKKRRADDPDRNIPFLLGIALVVLAFYYVFLAP